MDQWRENGFESKRLINYYTELSADVLILGCTLLQYLQLMVRQIEMFKIEMKSNFNRKVDAWDILWIGGYCVISKCTKCIEEST